MTPACGDNTAIDEHDGEGSPTGTVCPTSSSLTYDNFAKDFMTKYCTDCHSSTLPGASRQGAPSDHNFDTLAHIRATEAEHIDLTAAAGSLHVNTAMPPADHTPQPTDTERRRLGEWLACGMR